MTKSTLDRIFSEYVRRRDADERGYIRCYCCGKILHWKESQNMHFIPRQHMGTRFDEVNCHSGCVKCNFYNNGNIEEYAIHLKKDFGNDIIERLTIKKQAGRKFSEFEYKILAKHYREKINNLKSDK